jgi:hypothetical protein
MYWISIALIYFLERTWAIAGVGANATFTAPLFGLERMSGIYLTLYIEVLFYALIPVLLFSDRRLALRILAAPDERHSAWHEPKR